MNQKTTIVDMADNIRGSRSTTRSRYWVQTVRINYMFAVQDRISVLGHLGTVRYVGHLPVWGPSILAYGVEWDDPLRGKNNGEVGGVRYFTPTVAGAGSFIKATSDKIDQPRLLMEAVVERYAGSANETVLGESITFGTKTVEKLGFSKLNAISSDYTRLPTLMLDKQAIGSAGALPVLENVTYLDLSFNLLTSWEEVGKILQRVPNLQSLNLNGNYIVGFADIAFPERLTELTLASTNCPIVTLAKLDLSRIQTLSIASNSIAAEEVTAWTPWLLLRKLDLSFNNLAEIPTSLRLLQQLILPNNCIDSIPEVTFPEVQVLDLRYNKFLSWSEIDKIPLRFPNLTDLRISDCPLFDDLTTDDQLFNLVGRIPCIASNAKGSGTRKLNGSPLTEDEIRNAELYFISMVRRQQVPIFNKQRWAALLEKHNISESQSQPKAVDSDKITLLIRYSELPDKELFSRVFLVSNSVLRLKGIISRRIGVSVLDFSIFYYLHDDSQSFNATKQFLLDDIAKLQNLTLSEHQKIFIATSSAALIEEPQTVS